MVNDELLENIKARFQQGEKADQIKEALLNEGWSDGDIEAAFTQIRHEALLHIPVYAKVHNWMNSVDSKTSQLSTRTLIQIFVGIFLVFIGAVIIMFYFLDPLGVRTAERDNAREKTAIELRLSLEKYHRDHNATYPQSIAQLVPQYLAKEPLDPKTKKTYTYKSLANDSEYEFCVEFEVRTIQCISSDTTSSIPVAPQEEDAVAPPLKSELYAINGQMFFDVDKNGAKSDEEKGSDGIPVKIFDSTRKVVCDSQTDDSGIFSCSLTGVGQYSVVFTLPQGYKSNEGNPIQVVLPNDSNSQPNIETLFIGLIQ